MGLGRHVLTAILLVVGLATPAYAGDELSPRTTLIIDEFSSDSNLARQLKQTIHSTLGSGMTSHYAFHSEFLDAPRFNMERQLRSSGLTDAGGLFDGTQS